MHSIICVSWIIEEKLYDQRINHGKPNKQESRKGNWTEATAIICVSWIIEEKLYDQRIKNGKSNKNKKAEKKIEQKQLL